MKRKDFLKNGLLATGAIALTPLIGKSRTSESVYDKMLEQVGFNHLPNKNLKTMNSVFHPADSRGHANHGWLNSHHSFSFANYYNPDRMNFGVLRVLNDDKVQAGAGFGKHPHDNMEIISIPLKGDLEHKDSMGNTAVIKEGDVQVMSAGTGVFHSEYNKNKDQDVEFLQIWVFPNAKNHEPRYDQISIEDIKTKNQFYQILSPNKEDQGVWIHQNAWFHFADFDENTSLDFQLNDSNNGVYFFVLEGEIKVNDQKLTKRDGYGVWDFASLAIESTPNTRVLAMEVPMKLA